VAEAVSPDTMKSLQLGWLLSQDSSIIIVPAATVDATAPVHNTVESLGSVTRIVPAVVELTAMI